MRENVLLQKSFYGNKKETIHKTLFTTEFSQVNQDLSGLPSGFCVFLCFTIYFSESSFNLLLGSDNQGWKLETYCIYFFTTLEKRKHVSNN